MKLTDKAIKALKPKAGRYLVGDGDGLYLEVLPSEKMSWVYRYRLRGKPEKMAFGRYPDLSLKDARTERNRLKGLANEGISPAHEKKLRKVGLAIEPTVADFAERYFTEYVAMKYKDPSDCRRYIDKEIVPTIGTKRLKEVTALDVQRLVYQKRDHGLPMAGVALRGLLKRIFDYAVECHLVDVNPAQQVATKFIGKARQRTRALSAAEIRIYLRALYESNMRRQFKLALHLILLTLVRKSELLLAEWKDVNFEMRQWLIPTSRTKTGVPHAVYLSSQAVAIFEKLKALAGSSDLVLPGRGRVNIPFASNALNQALEGLTLGMDAFTIHDMRRTASTLLHSNGFKPDVIEIALGHKIGGIRGIYNVADYADERKVMLQWWADFVDSLMNESKVTIGNFKRA